jgi:hypothetical protein
VSVNDKKSKAHDVFLESLVARSSPILQQSGDFLRTRQLPLEFFGQALDDAVGRHANRLSRIIEGILDDGPVLFLAEDDSDGRVLSLSSCGCRTRAPTDRYIVQG